MKKELIETWMTRGAITIPPETTLPEAHKIMTQNGIRRLPVVKDGDLVGIVTLGDVREAEPSDSISLSIWEVNYLIAKLQVDKIMTLKPITVSPKTTIDQAAQLMLEKKISGLPVADDNGKIVGIITESDIFRLVVKEWGGVGTGR